MPATPTTLQIRVEPFSDFATDALDAVSALDRGETPGGPAVLSFDSAEDVTSLLTPTRLALLRHVMEQSPESIRALADALDRNVSEVHGDLERFHEYGIVEYRDAGQAKQPYCPYDTIEIDVTLTV